MSDCNESDREPGSNPNLIIAVGASAGGHREIIQIVESLPPWFQGTLLIANHRSPDQKNVLREILASRARVDVREPEDEECLECTTIYVGNSRDVVEVDGREFDVEQDTSRFARLRRIDDLFLSVAESAKENAVGIILSGMLRDGVDGLKAIHAAGGTCIVQDPDDAKYDSMPRKAIAEVPIDFVGTTEDIVSRIMEISMARDRGCE